MGADRSWPQDVVFGHILSLASLAFRSKLLQNILNQKSNLNSLRMTSSASKGVFEGVKDRYAGLTVSSASSPCPEDQVTSQLDRQKQTETDRDRQRQTETDRDRQRQTERQTENE